MKCSFCDRRLKEVTVLVKAPNTKAKICEACLQLSVNMLAQNGAMEMRIAMTGDKPELLLIKPKKARR